MLILKCIGAIAVLLSSLVISKKYEAHCNKKCIECQQILSFLKKMRDNINVYLLPSSRWKREAYANDGALAPFFSQIGEGCPIGDAFESVKAALSIPPQMKDLLCELFLGFGRGYMKEELARLSSAISAIEGELPALREESKRESTAARALIIACALGAVILLL